MKLTMKYISITVKKPKGVSTQKGFVKVTAKVNKTKRPDENVFSIQKGFFKLPQKLKRPKGLIQKLRSFFHTKRAS